MNKRRKIDALAGLVRETFSISTPVTIGKLESIITDQLHGILKPIENLPVATWGVIYAKGDNFVIEYRKDDHKNSVLFTVAHELGHYFLHATDTEGNITKEFRDSPIWRMGYGTEEAEANEFAAALLMPQEEYREFLFEHYCNLTEIFMKEIEEIAQHFNVSPESAKIRGLKLGYIRQKFV